jgi:hypothetical protein
MTPEQKRRKRLQAVQHTMQGLWTAIEEYEKDLLTAIPSKVPVLEYRIDKSRERFEGLEIEETELLRLGREAESAAANHLREAMGG